MPYVVEENRGAGVSLSPPAANAVLPEEDVVEVVAGPCRLADSDEPLNDFIIQFLQDMSEQLARLDE